MSSSCKLYTNKCINETFWNDTVKGCDGLTLIVFYESTSTALRTLLGVHTSELENHSTIYIKAIVHEHVNM